MIQSLADLDDAHRREVPRRPGDHRGRAQGGDPQGDDRGEDGPGARRHRAAQQGHPPAARRGDRLPAVAGRRAAGHGRRSAQHDARSSRARRRTTSRSPRSRSRSRWTRAARSCSCASSRGTIEAGAEVLNVRTNKKEKVARLFRVHANKRERLDKARRRRDRRRGGPQGRDDRRHGVRSEGADPARAHRHLRAGDLAGDRGRERTPPRSASTSRSARWPRRIRRSA